jgi:hypothetical protein
LDGPAARLSAKVGQRAAPWRPQGLVHRAVGRHQIQVALGPRNQGRRLAHRKVSLLTIS